MVPGSYDPAIEFKRFRLAGGIGNSDRLGIGEGIFILVDDNSLSGIPLGTNVERRVKTGTRFVNRRDRVVYWRQWQRFLGSYAQTKGCCLGNRGACPVKTLGNKLVQVVLKR